MTSVLNHVAILVPNANKAADYLKPFNFKIGPKRKTFYGALEIWAKDPSGKIIGFAQHN